MACQYLTFKTVSDPEAAEAADEAADGIACELDPGDVALVVVYRGRRKRSSFEI